MAHTSFNRSDFNIYCSAQLENSTKVYFDASFYDPSCLCVAHIEADPDIAGSGVMYAFIVTAFITVAVATIPASNELLYYARKGKNPLTSFEYHKSNRERPINSLVKGSILLLSRLCDLQVITGTAILIAGFAQWPEISFYHEQFVIEYWYLALTSFWAARADCTIEEPGMNFDHARILVRRIFTFVSVVLSVIFQCSAGLREDLQWSMISTGRCYVYHDRSPAIMNWFWIAGTSLYGVILLLQLSPWSRDLVEKYEDIQGGALEGLFKWTSEVWKYFLFNRAYERWERSLILRVQSLLLFLLLGFATVVCVVTLMLVDMFSYGSICYPLETALYAGLVAWSTYDLIDLKYSNEVLLVAPRADENSESSWGFGQVLPLALLVTLLFQTLDIARDETRKKNSESDEGPGR